MRKKLKFLFLNVGHFLDHLMTLVFATVAALALSRDWGLSYSELLGYATPGFLAFGLFSLPAGYIADKWSREGMIAVFFIGMGLAANATGFAQSPLQIGFGLFVVGVFAAIYHPVGLALVVEGRAKAGMAIAANGVWGNFGVGSAALIAGYFIDHGGWRAAFFVPGGICVALGVAYTVLTWADIRDAHIRPKYANAVARTLDANMKAQLFRIGLIVLAATMLGSVIFQSTTFALPKVFAERLGGIAGSATLVGWFTFLVFAIASGAQVIVGHYLDRIGARTVFMAVASLQVLFFALMPGLSDWPALITAIAFMLVVFGQIPITDYMISRLAQGEFRARVYGARFVVSSTVLGITLPLVGWVYGTWGFDRLFMILSCVAALLLMIVVLLPRTLPRPDAIAAPIRA